MAVFYSFYYNRDSKRVQQVINMGVLDGQPILSAQKWEEIKNQGAGAIQKWITDQMKYKTAVVVLVGAQTAGRPWVQYEIEKAWDENKPLLGIRIHGLADPSDGRDYAGKNPFSSISSYIPLFDPTGPNGSATYNTLAANLRTWASSGVSRT